MIVENTNFYNGTEATTGTATKTYHTDHLLALATDSGTITDRWEYSSYGTQTHRASTSDTPFQFHGGLGCMTDANGLVYMRARYYNPCTMRFLNADPIGFAGGMNWYSFVGNNPLGFVDPLGLDRSDSGNTAGTYARATFGPYLDGIDNIFYGTLYAGLKAGAIGRWALGEPNRWWAQDDEPSAAVARGFNWRGRAGWYDMNHPGPQFTRMAVEIGGPMKVGALNSVRNASPLITENAAPRITAKGLARVEQHLDSILAHQFGDLPRSIALQFQAGERSMLARLRSGARSTFDLEFYLHELKESARFRATGNLRGAHNTALEWREVTEKGLFHPDVIKAYPRAFNSSW